MKQKILLWTLCMAAIAQQPLPAQQTVTLDLSRPVDPVEITLDAEKGYWTDAFGAAPLVFEHFTFSHAGGTGYWSGFIVGSNGDTEDYGSLNSTHTDGWLINQWGNMAGGGIQTGSDGSVIRDGDGKVATGKGIPYLIANEFDEFAITFDGEYEAAGVYLNNHPWPFYSNLYGDSYARALDREGDYYKVIITGQNAEAEETGSVEHVFAEYVDGALKQSRDWERVDLSSLGKVSRLSFHLTSTDAGEWGMNTPGYFCLDKLQVKTSGTDGIITLPAATAAVYPNPAADRLTVSGTSIRRVTVSDLGGRTVCRLEAEGQSRLTIPVSHWGKGVYIVRVTDGTSTSSHKIIKR
ncbi:MAG: DUF4465 domain-containing protein [Tannerella sp.]|jgi:hypothetical protein|nr:DUF4465 domain-containing protein [Tannerella sp.]